VPVRGLCYGRRQLLPDIVAVEPSAGSQHPRAGGSRM